MSKFRSSLFTLGVLCLCARNVFLAAARTGGYGRSCKQENQVALFLFGDSFFDVGNNNYLETAVVVANRSPYGETFFKYPTGRFCDGRIVPDFIAEYLKLPLIPPYLQPGYHRITDGINFASGGAGALAETYQGLVINLKTQLSYFKKVETKLKHEIGDSSTWELLNKALFLFSIGNNDYVGPVLTNSAVTRSYTDKEYVEMVVGNITAVLKSIHQIGGRRFAFVNVPGLGCAPILRAARYPNKTRDGCVEEVNVLAKLHNVALVKALRKLRMELEGFEHSIFDLFGLVSQMIQSPSKYGFKEANVACCGKGQYRGVLNCGGSVGKKDYEVCQNPEEHLFFDSTHPTEKFNDQIARLMWNGSVDVSSPHNIKSLLQM